MKIRQVIKQFNWRFLLVRILVNAIALVTVVLIVPKVEFVDRSIWNVLLMAAMLGVLNALVKPIIQFLTYPLFFLTFGLITALTNALILILLSALFPDRFEVTNFLWALVAGLLLGLLSSFLESLMGLTVPVVSDEPPELRAQLEKQAPQADWFISVGTEAASLEAPDTLPVEGNPELDRQALAPPERPDPVPAGKEAKGDLAAPAAQEATADPQPPEAAVAGVLDAAAQAGEEKPASPEADPASVPDSQATEEEDPT